MSDKKLGKGSVSTENRREFIKKYGRYTAPTVVSLLVPSEVFGDGGGATFSSPQSCIDTHLAMGGNPTSAARHCARMH